MEASNSHCGVQRRLDDSFLTPNLALWGSLYTAVLGKSLLDDVFPWNTKLENH